MPSRAAVTKEDYFELLHPQVIGLPLEFMFSFLLSRKLPASPRGADLETLLIYFDLNFCQCFFAEFMHFGAEKS
jgi:hypothetical protein